MSRLLLFLLPLLFAASACAAMEPIRLSPDGRGFVAGVAPFTPWGLNYGNHGRLIEDFWNDQWPIVESDFRKMGAMGASVARVHLQFGKFMDAADRPNTHALEQLGRLLKLSEQTGVYLDLTGLACYRPADVPAWYDDLPESARWGAQCVFWQAVAKTCNKSPAIFCYDLMNEPFSAGGQRKPRQWYSGALLGGYDFIQFISLGAGNRVREDVPIEWIDRLSAAIRREDTHHLITVGILPPAPGWGFLSGFVPAKVAPHLDFLCLHLYPEKGKVKEAIAVVKQFAIGKPLVIEETFPLSCSADELKQFLLDSRGIAQGWLGHYDGDSLADLTKLKEQNKLTLPQAMYQSWLQLFTDLKPEMTEATRKDHDGVSK